MRIAQVAPLAESVPPRNYGGTERVVSYLTEELVRQGHAVTLFASGDSLTAAELVSPCPRALRTEPQCVDPVLFHLVMLEQLGHRAGQFDVIHFHVDYLHYPLSRLRKWRRVTTLHGRLDIFGLPTLYREYRQEPLVSISDSQRRPLPWCNWQATVYHGLPRRLYAFQPAAGRYLLFLGRISPEKRPDRAIEIALRAGMPLKIAAKVDRADQEYFDGRIRPLLDRPGIEFLGEVGGREKETLLGGAHALLMPVDWPEPFGLNMIEAMACGVPVIAWRAGAIPEVVDQDVTGIVVDSLEAAVEAVERVGVLSRQKIRQVFEKRFNVERMAADYVKVYEQLPATIKARPRLHSPRLPLAPPAADVPPLSGPAAVH